MNLLRILRLNLFFFYRFLHFSKPVARILASTRFDYRVLYIFKYYLLKPIFNLAKILFEFQIIFILLFPISLFYLVNLFFTCIVVLELVFCFILDYLLFKPFIKFPSLFLFDMVLELFYMLFLPIKWLKLDLPFIRYIKLFGSSLSTLYFKLIHHLSSLFHWFYRSLVKIYDFFLSLYRFFKYFTIFFFFRSLYLKFLNKFIDNESRENRYQVEEYFEDWGVGHMLSAYERGRDRIFSTHFLFFPFRILSNLHYQLLDLLEILFLRVIFQPYYKLLRLYYSLKRDYYYQNIFLKPLFLIVVSFPFLFILLEFLDLSYYGIYISSRGFLFYFIDTDGLTHPITLAALVSLSLVYLLFRLLDKREYIQQEYQMTNDGYDEAGGFFGLLAIIYAQFTGEHVVFYEPLTLHYSIAIPLWSFISPVYIMAPVYQTLPEELAMLFSNFLIWDPTETALLYASIVNLDLSQFSWFHLVISFFFLFYVLMVFLYVFFTAGSGIYEYSFTDREVNSMFNDRVHPIHSIMLDDKTFWEVRDDSVLFTRSPYENYFCYLQLTPKGTLAANTLYGKYFLKMIRRVKLSKRYQQNS